MKTFLAVVVLAGLVVGIALSQTSNGIPGSVLPPPPVEPPRPPVALNNPSPADAKPDLSRLTIEQLIEHITRLKAQRMELEKQEAKAVSALKERLRDANERAAQLEGWRSDVEKGIADSKKDIPPQSRRDDKK